VLPYNAWRRGFIYKLFGFLRKTETFKYNFFSRLDMAEIANYNFVVKDDGFHIFKGSGDGVRELKLILSSLESVANYILRKNKSSQNLSFFIVNASSQDHKYISNIVETTLRKEPVYKNIPDQKTIFEKFGIDL
jgi:hypothetical protein